MTYIVGLCLFIPWFMNAKLGQNRDVVTSAGINVDKNRIIAVSLAMSA